MSENEGKKPGDRVKETMAERRIEELLEHSQEKLAGYAQKLEYEYQKRERELLKEIEKLESKNEKLQKRIEQLENEKKPTHKYSGYPANKDYIEKLLFILSSNKASMTFEEIVSAFYLLEPSLNDQWRNPNKSISKIISRAVGFGVIKRSKIYGEHGCFVYARI